MELSRFHILYTFWPDGDAAGELKGNSKKLKKNNQGDFRKFRERYENPGNIKEILINSEKHGKSEGKQEKIRCTLQRGKENDVKDDI